jgi:hypothetical protein
MMMMTTTTNGVFKRLNVPDIDATSTRKTTETIAELAETKETITVTKM